MNATEMQTKFSIQPLSSDLAARIRTNLTDDFGNRLDVGKSGPVPCRHCLRITKGGEEVICFAHRPFDFQGPYAETGPVFIHARTCERYGPSDVFPRDFEERVLTMRAYNAEGRIEAAQLSAAGEPLTTLQALFQNERVVFVHVRNPAWGCYDFQVDRGT